MPARQKIADKDGGKGDVGLYISDEQAALIFPNMRGEIDVGTIFIGSAPTLYEWCNDLLPLGCQRRKD